MELYELSATAIVERLQNGSLSSAELVEALAKRRVAVDGKLNSFVHIRDEALSEARALDEERRAGTVRGPLHGLPITIKDNIDVIGTRSTLGLSAEQRRIADTDAVLVQHLKRLGAVILGKTNVPQLLLAQETENPLFGVTNNPWNVARVPGGSSGGEAAAVASGLSPVGIGTDIGGSIRIPAHFCGIVGFKPTVDRWSNRGSQTGIRGQEMVRAQIGSLTRTVADARLLWTTIDPVALAQLDPLVVPVPSRDPAEVDIRGMTIGYVDDDDFLAPTDSIRRAVDEARQALERAGAKLVRHQMVPTDEVIFLWLSAITADGGRTIDTRLAGDQVIPQLKASRTLMRLPRQARSAARVLVDMIGEKRVSRLLGSVGEKSVDVLWELTQRRTDLRLAEFDRWRRDGLDAVLCPPHVVPALRHRDSGDFAVSVGATFRWSLLNFPAACVPVTTVRKDETGTYRAHDRVEKKVAAIDKVSAGLPVGVQLVAPPHHEHVLLAVMSALEAGVRETEDFPRTPVTP